MSNELELVGDGTTINPVKQRVVSGQLGKNITKDHCKIYDVIEKRIGKTKKCTFGHTRGSKTGVKHEGCVDVPIREFELRMAYIFDDEVVIEIGDGLQGFCRNCSKLRRQARLTSEKNEKKDKSPEEIYSMYETKYGTNVKKCSRCETSKPLQDFILSVGMECGLHNMCKLCSHEYGSSVGDRWIIYMPDGNYKYNKHSSDEHDDHIFPLSLGGSNEEINHQLISSTENLKKSNDIYFDKIADINPLLLCERYRQSLTEATELQHLKILLHQYVYNDILERSKLNDDELYNVYKVYCEQNNLRRDVKRAVRKFREYCSMRIHT
jgi:hypothetical protein